MVQTQSHRKTMIRILGPAVILILLFLAALLLPVRQYLLTVLQWLQSLGPVGAVVLIILYVAACLLFLPVWMITVSAGFLYGLGWGTTIMFAGALAGAAAAFMTGRTLARAWIAQKIRGNTTFTKIDHAIERQGFRLVFFMRLSPVFPFSLMNYALGITKVPFWPYIWGTALGMLPGSVMYVYFGTAARSLTAIAAGQASRHGAGREMIFWMGLTATMVAVFVITRIAQKSLKDEKGGLGS